MEHIILEILATYGARSLPSVMLCFIGISAIKYGFRRFGVVIKTRLWIVILVLWLLGILSGLLFGVTAVQKLPTIALPIFFIGVLFWIVSLIFGSRRKIE